MTTVAQLTATQSPGTSVAPRTGDIVRNTDVAYTLTVVVGPWVIVVSRFVTDREGVFSVNILVLVRFSVNILVLVMLSVNILVLVRFLAEQNAVL